jgi:hypothetical protein
MNYAELDSNDWRSITFEGVTFPPTLMGISVLASILDLVLPVEDDELCGWLHSVRVCCGITKRAPATLCHSCAIRARDLMLEHRAAVLAGITSNLGPHRFDADTTFRDWIAALQRISELAAAADGDCSWSAPLHPGDKYKTAADAERFLDALDRFRTDLDETGND